jgi:hypothetical protein
MELRCGRWQDVLADVETCDAVITDPPYSAMTHVGWNEGEKQVRDCSGQKTRQSIDYESLQSYDAHVILANWNERARGWICAMTDDTLCTSFREAALACSRYSFAPVPIIQKRPRLLGDGPASWAVYLLVSRPRKREFSRWGCLPGAYFSRTESMKGIAGVKPLDLMQEIVSDYSRPGDLIVDLYAGSGTTLLAAAMEGRRCIGAEMDPKTYALAVKRLSKGYTERLPFPTRGPGEQSKLFDD